MIRWLLLAVVIIGSAGCNSSYKLDYPHDAHPAVTYLEPSTAAKMDRKLPVPVHVPVSTLQNAYPRIGIISHHLMIEPVISAWWENLRLLRDDIDTFIIISPRHFAQREVSYSFSPLQWQTDKGYIQVNQKMYAQFRRAFHTKPDPDAFHLEHGIGAVVPYIARYYPQSNIMPILFDWRRPDSVTAKKTADIIMDILRKNQRVFVLFSIDFSHHARRELTDRRDVLSKEALMNPHTKPPLQVHCDNTTGILVLFDLIRRMNLEAAHLFCATDGGKYLGKDFDDITSYFFMFYY